MTVTQCVHIIYGFLPYTHILYSRHCNYWIIHHHHHHHKGELKLISSFSVVVVFWSTPLRSERHPALWGFKWIKQIRWITNGSLGRVSRFSLLSEEFSVAGHFTHFKWIPEWWCFHTSPFEQNLKWFNCSEKVIRLWVKVNQICRVLRDVVFLFGFFLTDVSW